MPTLQMPLDAAIPGREKQSVALLSVLTAGALTIMKIVVGILTGSLGILSEGAHSGLDFVAAAVTYASVRLAEKPADHSHPFGHGKIEHLSALVETGLLLITCAWIVFEAVQRLFFHQVHVKPNVWAFAVLLISITLDMFRSRALSRVARKYNSHALEADALHFTTDIYSSGVVLLGLILISLAERKNIGWLLQADPISALAVAGIVVFLSFRLGRRTVDALVDAAPRGTSTLVAQAVSRVPEVVDYDRIRVRQSGNRIFIDLKLTLQSNISFAHADSVVSVVESRVHEVFPNADIVVHAEPREPAQSDVVDKIRFVAYQHNFQVHDVRAYEIAGRVNVNLDLEVDPNLTLKAAHEEATTLEKEIKEELRNVDKVNIHIEPLLRRVEPGNEAGLAWFNMERKLLKIARRTPGLIDCHSLEAHQVGGNIVVSLHCTMEPNLSVSRVHDITENLEFRFRKAFPHIFKVSIHAEPMGQR